MSDQVKCDFCSKDVMANNLLLHQAYCERNSVKCEKCDLMVDQNEMDEHMEIHAEVTCKYCERTFSKVVAETHFYQCDQKPKECPYCNLEIQVKLYQQHVEGCGSRTEQCPFCQKYIKIQSLEEHVIICQYTFEENNLNEVVEIPKQQPKPAANQQQKNPPKENPTQERPKRLKRNDSNSSLDSDHSLSPQKQQTASRPGPANTRNGQKRNVLTKNERQGRVTRNKSKNSKDNSDQKESK